jgi:hypothetical protein
MLKSELLQYSMVYTQELCDLTTYYTNSQQLTRFKPSIRQLISRQPAIWYHLIVRLVTQVHRP